jgi:hypothetical protein
MISTGNMFSHECRWSVPLLLLPTALVDMQLRSNMFIVKLRS